MFTISQKTRYHDPPATDWHDKRIRFLIVESVLLAGNDRVQPFFSVSVYALYYMRRNTGDLYVKRQAKTETMEKRKT